MKMNMSLVVLALLLAVFAAAIGDRKEERCFAKLAESWRNVFDAKTNFMRPKNTDGTFVVPFSPFRQGYGSGFTEGNSWQYTWHVLHDVDGLIAAMGGRAPFLAHLEQLFRQPEKTDGMEAVADVTGLIGQYAHGNEPSHHVPFLFALAGAPEKTDARVREICSKFYRPTPDGLCGNDDCGQMSAWYLFSAMGFYPVDPCGGEYVIGAPQVEKVSLHRPPSPSPPTSFTIFARNLSKENKYVKTVTLNGKPVTDWKLRHADILKGGELVFEMTGEK